MNTVMQSLKGLGSFRLMMLSLIGIILIVTFIFLTTRLTGPVYSPLYSDLTPQDSQKIAAQLSGMGVQYEIRGGGAEIVVPTDQVGNLRMAMAGSGLPSKGSVVGYEIFDKSEAMGTSNFVQNVNLLRALEGELARTISTMSIIDNARVHLVIPKRELFVKDKNEPSAAVVLKLKGGGSITKAEIGAISHLVASSVPGLKAEKVTIVDSGGSLLSRGGDKDEIGNIASTNQEYRTNFENKLKTTIEELIEKSLGAGKTKAQVSAEIDFDRIVTNSEQFDPDSQVARSIQTVEEKSLSSDKEGQEVSVANNLPDAQQKKGSGPSSTSSNEKTDETKNFEISKTVKNHIKETGTVKKLSVAVVVDGTYVEDKENKIVRYVPRSEDELDKIRSLVKSAIGFDEKRGDVVEVVNMQFSRDMEYVEEPQTYEWIKRDFDSILKTLVIGVVAVLVILLVIRPLVNRAFEIAPSDPGGDDSMFADASGYQIQGQQSSPSEVASGIDIEKIQNRGISASIKKISDVVGSNPEETLGVIRTWLNQK